MFCWLEDTALTVQDYFLKTCRTRTIDENALSLRHHHTNTTLGPRNECLSPHHDSQTDCTMAEVTPASPTLQGIPPELRNKIYYYLALNEPRNVSGCRLLKLHTRTRGGDIWRQFLLAVAAHPLTLTCRQMRKEFSSVLATTVGQPTT